MAYCDRCDRHFSSTHALRQHKDDSSFHWLCYRCDKDFPYRMALKQHLIHSSLHDYCRWCEVEYDDEDDLRDHWDNQHGYCYICNKAFESDDDLHEHNSEDHWYCASCRRVFQNKNNLDAHLNSSIHKPKNVRCPGANCGRGFVSMSALILHFESGTCPSGMTRAELNRLVVRYDRNNVITNPSRLIRGPDGNTPGRTTEFWATERSYNSDYDAYECFLCHKLYSTLYALNAHLKSPKHQDKIYRCPNRKTCGLEFSVMSALTQHVESDKCGVRRFRQVQDALDSLVSGMRSITF